ncbi:LytTR family transcriptional regulator DNA-binding domain-containing protein [Runella sp.]|uniref:LytTR family transcriptional regulator DNA-binding domain-containing protein n=1 Tax=Runella sp. TaxID=1960881 RepID=UPI003D0E0D03
MKAMKVDGIQLIPETISHLKGRGVYTIIVFVDGKSILSSKPLGLLCKRFGLMRIHKSTAINPTYVREIDPFDRIVMRLGDTMEPSRRQKTTVITRLTTLLKQRHASKNSIH